jgi:hypothetical protein
VLYWQGSRAIWGILYIWWGVVSHIKSVHTVDDISQMTVRVKKGVERRVRVVFGPYMVRAFTISPYITPKLYLKRLKTKPHSPIRRL